jgi:hypothetical protein
MSRGKHRSRAGRFLTGKNGGPGPPKGSRNNLSEDFVADLQADWSANRRGVLGRVRQDRPEAYLKVVASLIPRQIEAEVTTETSEYRLEKLADKLADYEAERG